MLSPSDFNNAVPQFTNGNYASNPINPQYVEEPTATEYNRGTEPLQTLPAQWWNWFLNRFTLRFNKLNIYVKNIFNELSQLLSLVSETPSGTEAEPTVGQLKDMFETKYPDYLKTTPALSNTFVPQTTTVNGNALSGNVTICGVACACCGKNGDSYSAFGSNAFNSTAFTTCTGNVSIADRASCNANIPVVLCTGATTVGRSTSCTITFNTYTGLLKVNCVQATCFSGNVSCAIEARSAKCVMSYYEGVCVCYVRKGGYNCGPNCFYCYDVCARSVETHGLYMFVPRGHLTPGLYYACCELTCLGRIVECCSCTLTNYKTNGFGVCGLN